jgi:hypothetical protein
MAGERYTVIHRMYEYNVIDKGDRYSRVVFVSQGYDAAHRRCEELNQADRAARERDRPQKPTP